MKTAAVTNKLERFFWIFTFINPFLDILNGMYLLLVAQVGILDVEFATTGSITPTLVVRMAVLLLFALYLLLIMDKKAIVTVIPMGIAFVLSVISEFLFAGEIQLFTDIQYMARFGYNILVMLVYTRIFKNMWDAAESAPTAPGKRGAKRAAPDGRSVLMSRIDKLIAISIIVLTSSIILSFISGIGYSTYADRLGYRGSRGFFYAGNDITAVLLLLTPLSMAKFMRMERTKYGWKELMLYALPPALAINCMLIIVTKTAVIAAVGTLAVMFIYSVVMALQRNTEPLKGFVIVTTITLALFAILIIGSNGAIWTSLMTSLGAQAEIVLNPEQWADLRQVKFNDQWPAFRDGGIMVWLFGFGRGGVFALTYPNVLERDIFEVLFYYGIFGACAMLWLYAKLGIEFLIRSFRRFDVTTCAVFIALGMCTGYLYIAGHILFSVTSGFYYAFTIVYSRVWLADKSDDIVIWKAARK